MFEFINCTSQTFAYKTQKNYGDGISGLWTFGSNEVSVATNCY